MIEKIISGGQTGVDQGSFDAAIKVNFPFGGYAPKGFICENGIISEKYKNQMFEMNYGSYFVRTKENIIFSDGTLIIFKGKLKGGSKLTYDLTINFDKPVKLLEIKNINIFSLDDCLQWINYNDIKILNVAGNRESSCPGIQKITENFIEKLIKKEKSVWR